MGDLPTPAEEHALVARAAAGDREAFAGLVRAYQVQLRALAALSVTSADDVLDIVQDAFIDAFEALPRFEQGRDFGPWLRTICRNRVASHHRRCSTQRRHRADLVQEALAEQAAIEVDGADERLEALRCCLGRLDDGQRGLLERRFRDEEPVQDIAAALGRSANAVSMLLLRLKGLLADCVERRLARGPA